MSAVAVIMGSSSDLNIMQKAIDALRDFGVEPHVEVVSAHRTPERMIDFAKSSRSNGHKVIIAGAGGAAHLPGMVASATSIPVIGVPILSSNSIEGIDSLLSIAQMPDGVPVATVAVNGAKNAGILAVEILALSDSSLQDKLDQFKSSLKLKVERMNDELKQNKD